MIVSGTLTTSDAEEIRWDLVVIGAGVAGAVAAREIARIGKRVLLVDKRHFPRRKVCGACLNQVALKTLEKMGLSEAVTSLGGQSLDRFSLRYGRRTLTFPLPGGHAVSREVVDAELIRQAIANGVEFLSDTIAKVGESRTQFREVRLTSGMREVAIISRSVVVASGLEGMGHIDSVEWTTRVSSASRIGAGCTIEDTASEYAPGTIWMAAGAGGYVGLVRVEQNRLNIAAAFDREYLRSHGSPGTAVSQLLESASLPVPLQLLNADWLGTVPLTRATSPVASDRVFLVGDAAGYVEPFTGEGMTWALLTGYHVAHWIGLTLAEDRWNAEIARGWSREHLCLIKNRQRFCRISTCMLRSKILLTIGMAALATWPWLARKLVEEINASATQGRLAHECAS